MKILLNVIFLLAAVPTVWAAGCPKSLDWTKAREIAPGVKHLAVTVDKPRLMANYLLRVDLRAKGVHVVGTGRAPAWGKPMDDYTEEKLLIDTRREKTRSFLDRHRAGGTNMVAAVNTAAWVPWTKPYNHKHGAFRNFLVSNGQVVSHATARGPMLVVFTNNTAKITSELDDALVPSVAVAYPGYDQGLILRDGKVLSPAKPLITPKLAPRTAFGLSADGRFFYALVVDGRQEGYSLGAEMADLARMLRAAGAADAINVDGGGSATLAYWDAAKGKSAVANRHDKKRKNYRDVAANVGIYLDE